VLTRGVIIQEGGLLGSQAIAKDYENRSVNVLAMSQVRHPLKLYFTSTHLIAQVRHDGMGQGCVFPFQLVELLNDYDSGELMRKSASSLISLTKG